MHEKKISQAEIAPAPLGRDPSTICRELRRNLRYP
ncbi:helix-turn-helix domain-containing protein (plasmid) [Sinorhizobium meliloti]|nr:helix-turn-helix domain-containing protein [Sinorhizobium meliloti]